MARPFVPLVDDPDVLDGAWSEVVKTAPPAADGETPVNVAKHVKVVVKRYLHDENCPDLREHSPQRRHRP